MTGPQKEPPGVSGHIEPILGRVQLVLGLVSQDPAAGVDDEGGDLASRLREPLHPEDGGHPIRSRPLRHGPEGPFLLRFVEREYVEVLPPQTRKLGLREAHDLRALGRRFG